MVDPEVKAGDLLLSRFAEKAQNGLAYALRVSGNEAACLGEYFSVVDGVTRNGRRSVRR